MVVVIKAVMLSQLASVITCIGIVLLRIRRLHSRSYLQFLRRHKVLRSWLEIVAKLARHLGLLIIDLAAFSLSPW